MLLTVIFNQRIIKANSRAIDSLLGLNVIHSLETSQEVTSGKVGLY